MNETPKKTSTPTPETSRSGHQFGTFKGVFVPSILTILGVIMYLRLGWILGNVGLFATLVIVLISGALTFLTALSIAATATNMKVGTGGAYYIISRSFGVDAGAAIGIPLFFAKAIGISFYIAGFSESIVAVFPVLDPLTVGIASLMILTIMAYRSASLALKAQIFTLSLIGLSLISFFTGTRVEPTTPLSTAVLPNLSFWAAFAIFFPAVTGIEAGVSMSGDLKNPSKSLPWGTLASVMVGMVIYLSIPVYLDRMASSNDLIADTMIMQKIASFGPLILLGIFGATLSSAMGGLLGAPRTLQALAKDHVVFHFLGKGYGSTNEPRIATAASFVIALFGLFLGDINVIAPILTMFFLTAYGFLNLAAGLESLIQNPSWRPSFRTPWWLSILGAIGCSLAMLMINAGATILATLCVLLIYLAVKRRKLGKRWPDLRNSLLLSMARYSSYRLSELTPDAKTWRPNVLVLSGSPTKRWHLIHLADAITHGKGLLTVASILPEEHFDPHRIASMEKSIREFLRKRNIPAFVKVGIDNDILRGAKALAQHYGLGPLVPNTILLGDSKNEDNTTRYSELILSMYQLSRNIVIVRESGPSSESHDEERDWTQKRIDVWWGRQKQNAGLMLALAYMLQTSPEWSGSILNLNTTIAQEEERETAQAALTKFLSDRRIDARSNVYLTTPGEKAFPTIEKESEMADLVFIGMKPPEEEDTLETYRGYYHGLLESIQNLPLTLLVTAAEEIKFSEIFEG